MTPAARFKLWKWVVAAWLGMWAVWLTVLSPGEGLGSTAVLVVGWVAVGAMGLGIVALLRTTPADAIVLPRENSERTLLLLTAALLCAALILVEPFLATDHNRYLAEGRMWLSGVSPYRFSPAEHLGEDLARARGVNHPDLPSLYPPVAQAVFVLTTSGGLALLRFAAAIAAVVGAWLLLRLLRERGRSAWWAATVVLGPVWIIETAGTPHVDIFGVCLMLAALLLWTRGRNVLAGLALGLACGVKPHVILALPFLARRAPLATLAGFALAAIPQAAALTYQGGWAGFLATSGLYATSWEANGSLFEFLKSLAWLGDDPHTIDRLKDVGRLAGALSVVLAGWLLWRYRAGPVVAAYVLQGLLLLTSPVVYPWYVLWVLPLAALVPAGSGGTAGLVAGATVGLSYLLGRLGQGWTLPAWALWLEWGPVYVAVLLTLVRSMSSSGGAGARVENPGGAGHSRAAPIASDSV